MTATAYDEAIASVRQRHRDALDELDQAFARTRAAARQLLDRFDDGEPDERPDT